MPLNPLFLQEFSAFFDADVIDISTPASLNEQARACAGNLSRSRLDTHQLISELKEFLHSWDQATLKELKKNTSVDWQFSPEIEDVLKQILTTIIAELGERPPPKRI